MDLTKLDSTSFANLCDDLVKARFPTAKCFEGRGGDLGIDCYTGDLEGMDLHIFQHKFLTKTLSNTGKGEIRKSLESAKDNFKNLKKWTLLLPKKFTFKEDKWFQSLGKKYNVEIEVWDETELKHLLYKSPSIRKEYLPLSEEDEKDLKLHFSHIIEKVINPLVEILKYNPEKLPNLNIVLTQKENHYSVDQNSINLPYDVQLDYSTIKIPSVDRGLCKDFLINHYSDIKNEWSDVHSTYDKYRIKIENINEIIHEKLKYYFNNNGIKFRNENEGQWINSIPINKFQKKLGDLLRVDEYNNTLFTYDDGYPDKVRITFSSIGIIYECKPNENYIQLIDNLKSICNKLQSELSSEIKNYKILKTKYENKVNDLIEYLIKITHTPRLRIKDNSEGRIKCYFME